MTHSLDETQDLFFFGFLSTRPVKRAIFVGFIFPTKIKQQRSFVQPLRWECPDSLGRLLLADLEVSAGHCTYMPRAVRAALFMFRSLFNLARHREGRR